MNGSLSHGTDYLPLQTQFKRNANGGLVPAHTDHQALTQPRSFPFAVDLEHRQRVKDLTSPAPKSRIPFLKTQPVNRESFLTRQLKAAIEANKNDSGPHASEVESSSSSDESNEYTDPVPISLC